VKKARRPLESYARTAAKAVSWRVVATVISMTIVFLLTRRILLTLEFGIIEVAAKITFYYLHERTWQKIPWGMRKHPLASLPVNREVAPEDMEKIRNYLKDLGYID